MSGTTTLSITLVAYVLLRPASFFFFYRCGDHRDLHSFPTRRSSDLLGRGVRRRRRPCERAGDRPTRDGDDEGDRRDGEGRARPEGTESLHPIASSRRMRSSIGGCVSKRWSKNAGASFSGLAM